MPLDPNKVFMFPESYNQLRLELVRYWPDLWKDPRCQWAMAFDMSMFIEFMNSKLDRPFVGSLVIEGDAKFCDLVCSTFLQKLKDRRGPDVRLRDFDTGTPKESTAGSAASETGEARKSSVGERPIDANTLEGDS